MLESDTTLQPEAEKLRAEEESVKRMADEINVQRSEFTEESSKFSGYVNQLVPEHFIWEIDLIQNHSTGKYVNVPITQVRMGTGNIMRDTTMVAHFSPTGLEGDSANCSFVFFPEKDALQNMLQSEVLKPASI